MKFPKSLWLILLTAISCDIAPPIPECPLNSDLRVSIVGITNTQCGLPTGVISVKSLGGSGVIMFRLDEGNFQVESTFGSVRPGNHVITVKDENNCSSTVAALVTSQISYSGEIKPIMDAKCNIPTCHDGSGSITFLAFANVLKSANDIKGLIQYKVMPKPGYPQLTNDEIEKITCWVDDGAKNN